MPLNRNNFLRFFGSFTRPYPTFGASVGAISFYGSDDSITFNPVTLCSLTASLGVDPNSIAFVSATDTFVQDVEYDGTNFTVYRSTHIVPTVSFFFSFCDYAGNLVPFNCIVTITFSSISTSWVPYPISVTCTLDAFGNNTGYAAWSQLVLVNSESGAEISPLTLKANDPSDPDYFPPQQNLSLCPVIGYSQAPLTITNNSKNPLDAGKWIVITQLYLYKAGYFSGGGALAMNLSCNIGPGQTRTFQVPSGISYDNIVISYTRNGDLETDPTYFRYWYINTNGSVTYYGGSPLVINTSPYTTGTPTTLPTSATGITIFVQ